MNGLKGRVRAVLPSRSAEAVPAASLDRLAREILGCIFTLLAIFVLISLVSYLPVDTLALFAGKLDQIHNLGGIVGAAVAAMFLGSLGAPGYVAVLVLLVCSISVFLGKRIGEMRYRIAGLALAAALASITCYLGFSENVDLDSLWLGGWLGRVAGAFFARYFSVVGSSIFLSGGFLVTLLLTTDLSLSSALRRVFPSRYGDEDEDDVEEPTSSIRVASPQNAVAAQAAPQKPKKKRRKKSAEEGEAAGDDDAELLPPGAEDAIEFAAADEFPQLVPYMGSASIPSTRVLKTLSSSAKKLSRGEMKENAQKLLEHLASFQITGEMTQITQGPVIVTYEFRAAAGVKLSKIENLQDDLGVVMGTPQLRIVAPIPGKTTVGIEVPRPQSEVVGLKEMLSEKGFHDKKLKLPVALGKTTDGVPVFADLAAMPHLLVAGGTGSGKSVFINSLILGFLFRLKPQDLRLILIDPKMLELKTFDGIPHLVSDVITDNHMAYNALNWAVMEMERRYALMADTGSKNIESYNSKQKRAEGKIPFLVIIVDELADLMMTVGKDVEIAITRLAQKARAAGIHLVLATQRPSTDVVTGLIKANMPSRISFKVPSAIDSRTVLDTSGAEGLMGRGDCLMIQPGAPLRRLHGGYVTEEDLARAVKYVCNGRDHRKNYVRFPANPPPGK